MEEQPQQNQDYDYTSNTNESPISNKSKLIWITLSIIILIGLTITLYFIFTGNSEIDFGGKIEGKETSEKNQDIVEIKKCLGIEEFDLNCNMLFSNPNIEEKCKETENLKDECFYKIATIYVRLDLCWQIDNNNLKQNCEMEINNIPISVPQDTDRFYPE